MTSRLRTLALALPLVLGACSSNTADPIAAAPARTVASMLPRLSKSLTPSTTETTFGKPDETTGSGLIIYVYRVEEGKRVVLSFPGFEKIVGARLQDASGATQELPLVD